MIQNKTYSKFISDLYNTDKSNALDYEVRNWINEAGPMIFTLLDALDKIRVMDEDNDSLIKAQLVAANAILEAQG